MEATINPNTREVHLYVSNITRNEIIEYQKHFKGMDDYEIFIHNPLQEDDLLCTFDGNINIDNLGNGRK